MRAGLRLAVGAAAGLAQALSIAWPFTGPWAGRPLWWLQVGAMALFVWVLDGVVAPAGGHGRATAGDPATIPAPRPFWRGFFMGWVFATAWLAGTWWWLYISLHTYGGLPAVLTVVAVLGLAAGLALYHALACGLFVAFAPAGLAWRALFFIALWTLGEWARDSLFTGFPWGAVGYAHVDGPLAAFASWIGAYGIGAVAVLVAALCAFGLRRRNLGAGVGVLGAVLLLVAGPLLPKPVSEPAGTLQVALLQGNIPQDEKFVPGGGVATALEWYGEQLRAAPASLVVTPETALPMLPSQLPPGYLDAIAAPYVWGIGEHAAIIGMPLAEQTQRGLAYSNGLLGLQSGREARDSKPYRYTKHHLVPFGEFIPPGFRWFIDLMHIPLGDFARGGVPQPRFDWQGQRIAPNICYEDLFGDEIGAAFVDAATAPTVLLNISNIAWFGDSVAIDQHLAISRMRALEFARPMLRATNTGATAVIDHEGHVTDELPRLTRGVLLADVQGRTGITPFAWWVSRFGLWPLWLAALAVVVVTVLVQRRRAGTN